MTFGSSFWKKGSVYPHTWCIFKSNITMQKYVIAKAGETHGSRTALLLEYHICWISNFLPVQGVICPSLWRVDKSLAKTLLEPLDIAWLESIQRRAARFVLQKYHHMESVQCPVGRIWHTQFENTPQFLPTWPILCTQLFGFTHPVFYFTHPNLQILPKTLISTCTKLNSTQILFLVFGTLVSSS